MWFNVLIIVNSSNSNILRLFLFLFILLTFAFSSNQGIGISSFDFSMLNTYDMLAAYSLTPTHTHKHKYTNTHPTSQTFPNDFRILALIEYECLSNKEVKWRNKILWQMLTQLRIYTDPFTFASDVFGVFVCVLLFFTERMHKILSISMNSKSLNKFCWRAIRFVSSKRQRQLIRIMRKTCRP